ncbi:MAG: helix-turn-helix transcriptional regulator [Bryobacterales bacterium]|nr:helix-turn-helix transcriptional regulator [Bryobacterales bacterium]
MPDSSGAKQGHVDFLELHILHHAKDQHLYGLWMIEELTHHGYRVGPSNLYPKFHRRLNRGYLKPKPAGGRKTRESTSATPTASATMKRRKRLILNS